jgi:hypothetical protein
MNNVGEEVRVWKETIIVQFKVQFRYLTGDSEENHGWGNSPAVDFPPSYFGAQKPMQVFMKCASLCGPILTKIGTDRRILVKISNIYNFIKITFVVLELFHVHRQTDEEILIGDPQGCESA